MSGRHSKQDHEQPEDLRPDADARHAPNVPEGRKKQLDHEHGGGEGGGRPKTSNAPEGGRTGSESGGGKDGNA